jgi:hypothetical protein
VRRLALLACTAALALAPAAAQGAIVPGATVDGPSADIPANNTVQADAVQGGADAAIAYLKNAGGVPHVFVARLIGGVWTAPERADTSFATASSNPRIAVAAGGMVAVTFANGGSVHGAVKPSAGAPFGPASNLGAGQYGEIDLAAGGNGYVAIKGTLLLTAARLEGTTFSPVPTPLNNDPTKEAGATDREAKLATRPGGGGAVVVWGEDPGGPGSVYLRTITGTTAGPVADVKLASLDGAPATATDLIMPDVGMDGTGKAWVVFRQFFTYGAQNFGRALARPLPPGGSLGAAQVVDGLTSPPTQNVEYPRVDVNAAGVGLTAHYLGTSVGVESAALGAGGSWTRGSLVNPVANTGTAFASPAIAGSGNGVVAWVHDPDGAGAQVRRILARTTLGGFGSVLTLSDPALGDLQQGQLTSAAGADFAIVGYVQGGAGAADARRVGAAVVDLPGAGGGGGGQDVTKPRLSRLRLSARRFRIGSRLPRAAAVRTGLTIRYRLSEAARVTLSFERVLPGRKVGKRCLKPKRANRRRKRCTRYVAARPVLAFAGQAAGDRRIRFEGRLSRRRTLKPGAYRLTLRARDRARNLSSPLKARVSVLPRKKPRR